MAIALILLCVSSIDPSSLPMQLIVLSFEFIAIQLILLPILAICGAIITCFKLRREHNFGERKEGNSFM